jgi:hypothetical protein
MVRNALGALLKASCLSGGEPMASETTRLRVQVIDAAADAQDLDQAAASLKDELLELDVMVSAEEGAEAPEGARGDLMFTLGGLVIGLAGTEVLATILNAVTAWLSRNQHRSVKLDVGGDVLEVTGIASKEQRELIDVWLHRRQPDARAQAGRRMALIVAGDEYQDPGLRRLRAPALDAEELAGVLGDAAIGGFDVRTMLNESTTVTNEAVEEFFADRHPDDLLLLHFSGHGVKNDNGELYFATPSTKLNRLCATAVSTEFVNRLMSRSRCRRIVLLLDCCYAGAFGRGLYRGRARTSTSRSSSAGAGGWSSPPPTLWSTPSTDPIWPMPGTRRLRCSPARSWKASRRATPTVTRTATWASTSCTTMSTTRYEPARPGRRRASGRSTCRGTWSSHDAAGP